MSYSDCMTKEPVLAVVCCCWGHSGTSVKHLKSETRYNQNDGVGTEIRLLSMRFICWMFKTAQHPRFGTELNAWITAATASERNLFTNLLAAHRVVQVAVPELSCWVGVFPVHGRQVRGKRVRHNKECHA